MKSFKKIVSAITSPVTLGLVVTVGVTYAALEYYASRNSLDGKGEGLNSLIQEIHEKTIDWRLNDRGQRPGIDNVAILAVDDPSIELEGRWPWPRDKQAKLIDRAMMYGAKSISFDVSYAEEDHNSALNTLARIKEAARDPSMVTLLEEESSKSDLDGIFANSIKAYQDNLILGAFFLGNLTQVPGFTELCLDAHFERTYASRYWKKEANQLTVMEAPQMRIDYPSAYKGHLAQYFVQLETDAAITWMEKHPEIAPRITKALAHYPAVADPEIYGGLATLVLNNDYDGAKALLEQVDPKFADVEHVKAMFNAFANAFDRKDKASFKNDITDVGRNYCQRFFTKSDELLSAEEWTKRYGDTPEAKETFAAISWASFWNSVASPSPEGKVETVENAVARIKEQTVSNSLPVLNEWTVNHPLLAEATKHTGYFNAVQDTDGSIRRSRLIMRFGNSYTPSLALKTFLVNNNYNAIAKLDYEFPGQKDPGPKTLKTLEINNSDGDLVMRIPVDHRGNMMINYSGKSHIFPHVPASEILSDADKMTIFERRYDPKTETWAGEPEERIVDKKEFLKDKVLIFGATAIGVYDLRVTPFEENFPGVETHANALSNLMAEHARVKAQKISDLVPGFLRTHPDEPQIMLALLTVIGVVLSILLSQFGSIAGLAITAAALGGVYGIDKFYLFRSGTVAAVLFPVSLIALNFVTLTFYKYFTEERKKRELKGTFEKYVSPAIVAEVLADPGNIELGGKKMELTVMFSDVRGFTTISEKLDPRALSDLLNSYLTPMTNLVFEHKGTLDKYMGDAIMAFWGAPVHFKDHAQHACRCALVMLTKLEELRAEYRAKGLPDIDIGIGLNTGEMSVGNMGSDTVRSYTVMGDAVNLGSRLEGINKQYGTRIIISEFTRKAIGADFVCREVDWVKVKGKAQPVRIFELVAEKSVDETTAKLLEKFNEGFKLYHEQKWTEAIEVFKEALAIRADDACSELYLERCQDYLKEPPPADWDGVFTMTSK